MSSKNSSYDILQEQVAKSRKIAKLLAKRKANRSTNNLLQEFILENSLKDHKSEINESPSTNYSELAESQNDIFGKMIKREKETKERHKRINDQNNEITQKINRIAQQREFSSSDYELLLRLDEHKTNDSIGLSDEVIGTFKYWKIPKDPKNDKDQFDCDSQENNTSQNPKQCIICISNIIPGQMARILPCEHIFHKKCVDKWLKTNCRCPIDYKNLKDLISVNNANV